MQTHLTLRTLSGPNRPDKDIQALFSANPNRKAVLFIHGYKGDAISTWSDFHELLPGCAARHDIFFYGFDGLRADMIASAAIFRSFLTRLFDDTGPLLGANLPPSAQRPNGFRYDELTIVAHSLGAVIARRALLDATQSGLDWVRNIKLILFAPAHMGARVVDLALEATSPFKFLRLFGAIPRFWSPLIDQLRANSVELKSLREDTDLLTQDGANPHLVATKVVIADQERIVVNQRFCKDPAPDAIPGTTHSTVCKPSMAFRQPLLILEGCL